MYFTARCAWLADHYDEPTLDFNGMASEAHNWAVQTLTGAENASFARHFILRMIILPRQ